MTEKEVLQQQETNGQTAFYLIAVGMFYHAYGCGAFALARTTGYRVLRKQKALSTGRYAELVKLLDSIGRQATGWKNKVLGIVVGW